MLSFPFFAFSSLFLLPPTLTLQIAVEAEAAMFHRLLFEELVRSSRHSTDPIEAIAMGSVEASYKCLAAALIVLTNSGR